MCHTWVPVRTLNFPLAMLAAVETVADGRSLQVKGKDNSSSSARDAMIWTKAKTAVWMMDKVPQYTTCEGLWIEVPESPGLDFGGRSKAMTQ
jgi:hypothetical protein